MSDHTDPGHVTGSHERTTRSGPRVGDSGAPVGSPLTIVLALIAVAVGFLIFRSISDDGDALGGGVLPDGATTVPAGATAPGQTTTPGDPAVAGATTPTTAVPDTRSGATVVVANASSTGQVAQPMSDQLAELGYTMGEATSQIEGPDNLEVSIVYFSVGNNCEAVARTLGNDMGGLDVEAMPAEVPTEGNIVDGCVLLMLGNDLAGEEVPGPPPQAPAAPTTPTTTG
jgi:hypothetical protein